MNGMQGNTQSIGSNDLPGQVVLVLQGGGALGAYQAGVYQALMEGGIEPDWVIGTSIGAINGAIIAGNEPDKRVERLREFWQGVGKGHPLDQLWPTSIFGNSLANMSTLVAGVPGFFTPNPNAIWGPTFPHGVDKAAYYSTEPLKDTLGRRVDFEQLGAQAAESRADNDYVRPRHGDFPWAMRGRARRHSGGSANEWLRRLRFR